MPEIIFDATVSKPIPAPLSDRDRAIQDEVKAKASGFAPAAPIYAIGTPVIELGRENFRASRQDIAALPRAPRALDDLIERVQSERRRDMVVEARTLGMLQDGQLTRGTAPLPLSERAFAGLCTLVTPGGAAYLAKCPAGLRADHVNHWLKQAEEGREVTLRARKGAGGNEIFAVVGPRYAPFDADRVAAELKDAVPRDAACDLTYDGYRLRANVLFHSNIEPERVVAGEIFKAGIRVYAADDGTGSIKVAATVWRNLCLNLIIVDQASQSFTRRRHMGRGIAESVRAGIGQAMESVKAFASSWGYQAGQNVLTRYGASEPADIFGALIDGEHLPTAGIGREALVDRLVDAWGKEPGYQGTDILNAITRAAHESSWSSVWQSDELEAAAGKLLASRDWKLQIAAA